MNCKRAEKLLPLLDEGLGPDAARRVTAHLERCPRCRAVERDLTEARRWLQSAPRPPLGQDEYAAMRREVWRQIEARQLSQDRVSPRFGRLVLVGGGILAAVLAALLIARRSAEPPRSNAVNTVPSRIAEPLPEPGRPATESLAPPTAASPVRIARGNSQPGAPRADSGVVRIEFRTANPNVRIIWLVKKGEATSSALTTGRNEEVS